MEYLKILLLAMISLSTAYLAFDRYTQKSNTTPASQTAEQAATPATAEFAAGQGGSLPEQPIIKKAGGKLKTPTYPEKAFEEGMEGTVIMDVLVDPQGRVKNVKTVQGSGYSLLDVTAMHAAYQGRYETNGRWVNYKGAKIVFKLD